MGTNGLSPKQMQAAQVAHVLARAVRDGEVRSVDVLRILRHELRRRNTNRKLTIPTRSRGAEAAIAKYAPGPVPKNDSDDALHADHVYPLTETLLREVTSLDAWTVELARLDTVVCVTAKENYALEIIEKAGTTGPEKYDQAGIEFTTGTVPWRLDGAPAPGAFGQA